MAVVELTAGQIVRVRSRQYLIEEVIPPTEPVGDTVVRLACLDDDAQGQSLEVFWEREVDAIAVDASNWASVVRKGFDNPRYFSSYLHALRWNCVTSTNPRLFQAPYRAGIEVKAYQLEPLRKALLMPRVSLFIADDVGLGKTIEAGLILREMLMRQRIKRVLISCPPSVVQQWKEEMQSRFGLTFVVFDRQFVTDRRRERGYGINPWNTHTRFILSHALLRDETYAAPLRDWLGEFSAGAMLILDEAHNAAPASGSRYAIDSRLTKTVRDIAPRFEHKLFLSATPHNGHSNSLSALLEILDPQRFCRGVKAAPSALNTVMVRRLKQDLREIGDADFPRRDVRPIVVDGLPDDHPALVLSQLLQEYRACREERLRDSTKKAQTAAMLVTINLQKRLLSSVEAFARTLKVHRKAIARQAEQQRHGAIARNLSLLLESPGADDDRAELSEEEIQAEESAQVEAATRQSAASGVTQRELELLERMTEVAEVARYEPDGRIETLVAWIRENLCPRLGEQGAEWSDRRVLIFTEYADTKRYLVRQLNDAIAGSHWDDRRIGTFHGGMGEESREAIKVAFNADPTKHPLRILIATDAAREGVNLQNYCADLFHFDVPWNPSRMEQRNGRIDRKLQREQEVRCRYFILPQREEDRVLEVLVEKTKTIQEELGSLSPVIQKHLSKLFDRGIRAGETGSLLADIEAVDTSNAHSGASGATIAEELEAAVRTRHEMLIRQNEELQEMLKRSRQWLGLEDRHFRDALSASLEMVGASPLQPLSWAEAQADPDRARWSIPTLEDSLATDPSWSASLDSLRAMRKQGQKLWEWRKEAPIRPVVFRDPGTLDGEVVHLHLEHRLVQRLLGRFLSQGFLHDELTRACVVLTDDPVPKVLVLGRLSLYGERASRLHDEIVAVTAAWSNPEGRGRSKLKPLTEGEKANVLQLLETSLATPRLREVPQARKERLQGCAARDVEELIPHLERRAEQLTQRAMRDLTKRGEKESKEMRSLLETQRDRIVKEQRRTETDFEQLVLGFAADERRQKEADIRHWQRRLRELETEITSEPQRIKASYEVKAHRVELVGLVYLWPVSS